MFYVKLKVMFCATCYFLQSEQSSLQETRLEIRGDTCRKGSKCLHKQRGKTAFNLYAGKNRDLRGHRGMYFKKTTPHFLNSLVTVPYIDLHLFLCSFP